MSFPSGILYEEKNAQVVRCNVNVSPVVRLKHDHLVHPAARITTSYVQRSIYNKLRRTSLVADWFSVWVYVIWFYFVLHSEISNIKSIAGEHLESVCFPFFHG